MFAAPRIDGPANLLFIFHDGFLLIGIVVFFINRGLLFILANR